MRYLAPYIKQELHKKMILLSGPRQSGKSTLAKSLLEKDGVYLNWDIRADKRIIRQIAWPKNSTLVVLNELHKYAKWKNYLKGIADEFNNTPPILVTGSARLDTFRREGDALTGRYYHYHLHPIDLAESKFFLPALSIEDRINRLLLTGGFPEAFLNPMEAERLRNNRFDLVIQEDLRDLSKTNSLRGIQLLIELLRERVGCSINYATLAEDLSVSPPTVKNWIELLERLYILFLIPPYYKGFVRSIRKEHKLYFYDCAAAYEDQTKGARLENMVACALFKFCQLQQDRFGKNFKLFYFRDRENREVDFVITLDRKIHWCIEVKTSDTQLSPSLEYLHQRAHPKNSFQIVLNTNKIQEIRGIRIEPLGVWLDQLFLKKT